MESIVLQLYGSKSWNIYPAAIPLSFKSQTRRPEPHEVSNVSVKVTLNVGDLMYIPSGVIHEAYTLDNSISMHLTLGIFYPEVCSYAGLLHSLLTVNVMIRRRVETCDATFSRLQVQVSNQKSSIECKEASEIVIRHTLTNLMLTLKSVAFSQFLEILERSEEAVGEATDLTSFVEDAKATIKAEGLSEISGATVEAAIESFTSNWKHSFSEGLLAHKLICNSFVVNV
mmetsp:Transcript_8998/g.14202  ORF Transcript_8998/g.14202 Transcript_8998/m.14202 type:complete len:228 (-) Transcript_8998:16-699(-)